MTCKELAKILLETPDHEVVKRLGDSWIKATAVRPTQQHARAVFIDYLGPDGNAVYPCPPDPLEALPV